MQEEQKEEEQDPRFYDLPLPTRLSWTRWLAPYRQDHCSHWEEEDLGCDRGAYLKIKKEDRIARLRSDWSARGRELDVIKHSNSWRVPRDS